MNNDKTIRIKLKKVIAPVYTNQAMSYRIETMTNAVLIDTGYANKRRVGDKIGEAEAEYLCADRRTEVSVS